MPRKASVEFFRCRCRDSQTDPFSPDPDGWNLIQEGANFSNAARLYFHGGRVDEIVASYNVASDVMAYHYYDASGHCTMLTDWQGIILEQYYYDAFGFPYFYNGTGSWLGQSPHGNRFLFTGREWLADLKLYDYRHRLYQPELGRFLQPDPVGFEAGDKNLYRYCGNDPVNRTDPTGLLSPALSATAYTWNHAMWMQGGSQLSSYGYNLLSQGQAYLAPPTGNYKDTNIENHVSESKTEGKPGNTIYTVSNVTETDGKLIIRPTLDWYVQDKYKHTNVVKGELEHVNRYLYWQSEDGDGAAAVRNFNRSPNGIDSLKKTMEKARVDEKIWQRNNIHAGGRHILQKNPTLGKSMDPSAIQELIKNVRPVELPYLGN